MPKWAVVVAILVALIPATWFTAQRAFDSSASPSDGATDLPIPPVSPSATTPAPTTSPPAALATTPAALPKVAPGAPRRIVSGSLIDSGFDSAVTGLEAASTGEVARLESRGSPGSPGTDTVYVIGKVLTDEDSAFAGLPRLRVGSAITLRTDSGTMTYTVRATTLMARDALASDPLFTAHAAGRLVLVGIRYAASGDELGKALVVTAQLTGAKRS